MIKYENQCVGCTDVGLYCMGVGCPNRKVAVYYCDQCGAELYDVFMVDGEHLCESCLHEMFRVDVEVDE